jgi:hypothetical protein
VDVNFIKFAIFHTNVVKDYTEAFRWTKDRAVQCRVVNGVYVAVNNEIDGHLTDAIASAFITQFTNFSFGTMNEFTKTFHNVCVIREDPTRGEGYNCTCRINAKEHICIHSLGVAIRRGLEIPQEARATLLGRKRRRGRRPHVAPAWEHEPFDIVSPVHHPQQDPAILAGVVVPELNLNQDMINENIDP